MDYTQLLVTDEGPVRTLTLNRPEARNALSPTLVTEIVAALEAAALEAAVRVVVLTGAGDKAFCAGGDLGGGGQMPTPYERFEINQTFVKMLKLLHDYPKPTIARINGYCLAGGFGLAASCDFIIAHDAVEFGTPEIDRGLFPMMIMAAILRTVPRKRALEMLLLGDKFDTGAAERMGLTSAVVPAGELDATVAAWAARLAAKSPAVVKLGKHALATMEDMTFDQALEYLNTMLFVNTQTEDAVEGIMAFFQKRPPEWKGR